MHVMNHKLIYETIKQSVYSVLNEETIVNNRRGRPTTTSKLSNLYPMRSVIAEKPEERYIRAWINTEIKKKNKIFYLDNIQDVESLRGLFIGAIYKFMEKNKEDDFNWESGDERYTSIYNLNDLSSFQDDIRKNYSKLCKNHNFPFMYIQLNSPKPTVSKRSRKSIDDMSDENKQIIDEYINDFGKGTPIDEIDDKTLLKLAEYKLNTHGVVYSVCRPIDGGDSDPNAPALVYKLNSKYSVGMSNAIRLTYKYQCEYEYNCYVDYMYCSSIHLDKYLRNEY